jgi:hypothetical protein
MAEKIAGGVLSEAGSLAFYSAMAPSTPSAKLSKAAMVALEARVRTIVKEDIDKELNDSQRLDKLAELIESHHRKSVGRNNAIL